MVTLTGILMSTRTAPKPITLDRRFSMIAKEQISQRADSSFHIRELDEEKISLFVGQEPPVVEQEVVEQEAPKEIRTPSFLESLISGISSLLKTILQEFKQNVQSTMSKIKSFAERTFSTQESFEGTNTEFTKSNPGFTAIKSNLEFTDIEL